MKYYNQIDSPDDLKKLKAKELQLYADEVREKIIETVPHTGGHLSSNLGVVELSVALHYVFDSPRDKIIFDVGHQCYTHKIITGRKDKLDQLRTDGGITGFPCVAESEHDVMTTGHSSTSLSVAAGLARACDFQGKTDHIICVIGDGAMTGGMAYEAINDIGANKLKVIIVLNDNKMSISKNVGAMSKYLARLRSSKKYAAAKMNIKKGISALPFFGDKLIRGAEIIKDGLKATLLSSTNKMFENFGIKYLGPLDGHNINQTADILRHAKEEKGPVLIHLLTKKGKGLPDAEQKPDYYHGVIPASAAANGGKSFSEAMGKTLCEMAKDDDRIVAITAAMEAGTGLDCFSRDFPDRYIDVGIAEQHAVTMAAGLAAGGFKPYFAVYSSFLQRGFDQIIHDVAIQNLPVTFLIDRAGVIGADGVTHQGVFDLSYLTLIPNMTVFTPADGNELSAVLRWSKGFNLPLAIRYPKSFSFDYGDCGEIAIGKWRVMKKGSSSVIILAAGSRMLDIALKLNTDVTVVNARFIKPLDEEYLSSVAGADNIIITLEDNVKTGGFGESVLDFISGNGGKAKVKICAHPDKFIFSHNAVLSYKQSGLDEESIARIVDESLENQL